MAIRCPRCGLEYDVALFQFGRTIDCSCGARVGCDARFPHTMPGGERRFLADGMLMGLARWLRILGYDTVCEPALSDAAMVRRCYEEGRALLTRDRKLATAWRVPELYAVRADKPLAQLQEVFSHYELSAGERMFTRCSRCNVSLQHLVPGQAAPGLPPDVSHREPITRCPACGRLYWEGSHVERMRRSLAQRLRRGYGPVTDGGISAI